MTSKLHSFELFIVGDTGVGKSCLMSSFVDNTYSDDRTVTHGAYNLKVWAIDLDGTTVKLIIHDMTGVKRMRPLVRTNFVYADGFIVAYDCTDLASFKNVGQWIQDIDQYGPANANKLLVGTKCDLVTEKKVNSRTAKAYADELQIPFFETSAKEGTNIEEAFVTLATQIKNRVDPPLTVARPAKRMKTEQRLMKVSNHSSTSRQESSKARIDVEENSVTSLTYWTEKLKECQENSTKIAAEHVKEVASGIEEKFAETEGRLERLENRETAACATSGIIGENILCEACQRSVKVKLQECNIL